MRLDRRKMVFVKLKKPALIVVDMQNAFLKEDGSLHRAGFNISLLQSVVQNVARVITVARRLDIPIVYSRHTFRKDFADAGSIIKIWPSLKETSALIEGSWDAQIVDEVRPLERDFAITKHRFSAFYNTDLEIILRCLGIQTVILVGITTNVCVESTVRDAQSRDFEVVVVSDCTAAVNKNFHEASLENIEFAFGKVISMNELLKSMENKE